MLKRLADELSLLALKADGMAPNGVPGGNDVVQVSPEDRTSAVDPEGASAPRDNLYQGSAIGRPKVRIGMIWGVRKANGRKYSLDVLGRGARVAIDLAAETIARERS